MAQQDHRPAIEIRGDHLRQVELMRRRAHARIKGKAKQQGYGMPPERLQRRLKTAANEAQEE